MPTKKAPSTQQQDTRTRAHTRSQERKALRRKANETRAQANADAGRTPKRQTRKRKADNMRLCVRCTKRVILAGSVCWCSTIGAA